MKKINLNHDWYFQYDAVGDFAVFTPSVKKAEKVSLPHDFIIGLERDPQVPGTYRSGYYPGAAGIYIRYLENVERLKNKKVVLEFDGALMNAVVMLNSDIVQKHPYGYTAFHADLTKYLKQGKKNKISVYVNNCSLPNTRWYTGAGLYRDVNLLISEMVHLKPWGIFIKTEQLKENLAELTVEAEVENESEADFHGMCRFEIKYDGKLEAEINLNIDVNAGESQRCGGSISVKEPHLWEPDSPALYQLMVIVSEDGREMDTDIVDFGIRTVSADAVNGLLLNGKPIKLKGGCIHHDCGILGAAAHKDYEYRKIKLHKENGFNAIRCAHNPPSAHLLEACDRYGVLVMDEAFDCWRMGKTLNDYSLFFEDWWERDLAAMILRDRNHPSVIMWSIGNETGERAGDSDGYEWAEKLASFTRRLDDTRLITSGICAIWPTEEQEDELEEELRKRPVEEVHEVNLDTPFSIRYWGEYTEKYAQVLDVVGYNYMHGRYIKDGEQYPERVICGTESFPMEIDRIWDLVEKCPYVIGDFTWVSYDYIGEAGVGKVLYFDQGEEVPAYEIAHISPYPWRLSYTADFDLCGFLTPRGQFRKIVWGSGETYIAVHNPANYDKQEVMGMWGWPECHNHFTYPGYEGKHVLATVYSKSPEVELFHNGKSLGKKKTQRLKAVYDFVYEPGELRAVSYEEETVVSEAMLETAGSPYRLRITAEPQNPMYEDSRLQFMVIEVVDSKDRLVPVNDKVIEVHTADGVMLKGLGTGNPCSEENYTGRKFTCYEGKVLAIVEKEDMEKEPADLCVWVSCERLISDTIKV